jgi:hypothetical protein
MVHTDKNSLLSIQAATWKPPSRSLQVHAAPWEAVGMPVDQLTKHAFHCQVEKRAKKGVKGTRESTIACSESPTYLRGRLITASWGRSRNMQLLLKEKPPGKGASLYNLDSGVGFTLMSNPGYRRR